MAIAGRWTKDRAQLYESLEDGIALSDLAEESELIEAGVVEGQEARLVRDLKALRRARPQTGSPILASVELDLELIISEDRAQLLPSMQQQMHTIEEIDAAIKRTCVEVGYPHLTPVMAIAVRGALDKVVAR